MKSMPANYDAILVLSFGGPEKTEDVIPFLENVLRGKNVPHERLLEVAEHYYHFGGRSPINDQNRDLMAALRRELTQNGPDLPVFWGNRNWHPFLADTLREMQAAGIRRVLTFVTSAFSSYSGCRQYLEDIERARAEVGAGAPIVDKLRGFFNHPGFIETMRLRLSDALAAIPLERQPAARIVFTAHSIPVLMGMGSPYVAQLQNACELVAAASHLADWTLAYQSRSGPPSQPWLDPDLFAVLRRERAAGVRDVVAVPIGFVSDHMEVLYDLDTEASALAAGIGLHFVRAATAGSHPRFVAMIRELIQERMNDSPRAALGILAPPPDFCPAECCPVPKRPAARPSA